MEINDDKYNDNMRRSLTVWAPLDTTVPQMIKALQKIFGDSTNQQVIGIEIQESNRFLKSTSFFQQR